MPNTLGREFLNVAPAERYGTRLNYPNPFFDLSRLYYPKTVKHLFRICKIFFYKNEFIHNVIFKLAEYPVTDFIFEGANDPGIQSEYVELFNYHLKLKSFLIEVGLDYFTYGNAIISANMKFKRFLKCTECGFENPIEQTKYKFTNYNFVGKCEKCGREAVTFKIQDHYSKSPKALKFIRWNPESIDIEYDELTGDSKYYYTIHPRIRKAINAGRKPVLETTPAIFIEALKSGKRIELDPGNLYHFKRPTLAEEDMGWGKPLILPAIPMLWYLQTLRRGNEAIVADHLVPMRSVFPSSQGTIDPYCLDVDSFILTKDGIKQAGELTKNDILITENHKYTKIKELKFELAQNLYKIHIHGLSSFNPTATNVHPFRVYDTQEIKWKSASELTTDDLIVYPRKKIKNLPTKYLLTKNLLGEQLRKCKHNLPEKIELTNEVLQLFGLYLAEGCSYETGKVEFAFHTKEQNYYQLIKKILDSWLPESESKVYTRGNSTSVAKYSVYLQKMFSNLLGNKCTCKTTRKLPELNRSQLISLLKGVYQGDGTFFYEKNKFPRLALKSINLNLIVEIREHLISLGYYPTIVRDKSYSHDGPVGKCYQLKLTGYQAEQLAKEFGFKTQNRYTKDLNNRYTIYDNFITVKINKIEKIENAVIAAFEVEDATKSYLSLGFINHNTQINLGKWRSQVETQVGRWRQDPNHIGIFPIPMGLQQLGGQAKMLNATPEMKFLEESIINSFGVPIEFIKGGSTWTSSSVSLRIVENHFLQYREQLAEFLNFFVIPKIKGFLKYPPVKIRFQKFKMSDDAQHKEFLLMLSQTGKLADEYILTESGIDYEENKRMLKNQSRDQVDRQRDMMTAEAKAQAKGMEHQAKGQARAQEALIDETARIQERKFTEELMLEMQAPNEDPSNIIQRYAIQLSGMQPREQDAALKDLAKSMPLTFGFVINRLRNMMAAAGGEQR